MSNAIAKSSAIDRAKRAADRLEHLAIDRRVYRSAAPETARHYDDAFWHEFDELLGEIQTGLIVADVECDEDA